jgi:hypothetical protein
MNFLSNIDLTSLISYLATPLAAAISFWAGKKKSKNDFLQALQSSIDMLSTKNAELLAELVAVKELNVGLAVSVKKLETENSSLKEQVSLLTEQLTNVKIITKIEKPHNV